MKKETLEMVVIKRMKKGFKVWYNGTWTEIKTNDLGYGLLDKRFPAIKAAHGEAVRCKECGILVSELINHR